MAKSARTFLCRPRDPAKEGWGGAAASPRGGRAPPAGLASAEAQRSFASIPETDTGPGQAFSVAGLKCSQQRGPFAEALERQSGPCARKGNRGAGRVRSAWPGGGEHRSGRPAAVRAVSLPSRTEGGRACGGTGERIRCLSDGGYSRKKGLVFRDRSVRRPPPPNGGLNPRPSPELHPRAFYFETIFWSLSCPWGTGIYLPPSCLSLPQGRDCPGSPGQASGFFRVPWVDYGAAIHELCLVFDSKKQLLRTLEAIRER
ncbi:uncharacterized protein LOC110348009 [Heterocephalus glaber]|uniref:Uncharacterized protein LOC110348009 n=1 Tax=Heterocephalus glaber TaxID=10181 RepID=A0AAX6SLX9_HETGA|nr:uncharacterized protein LOC110348009 [Heterocephalus glaber]